MADRTTSVSQLSLSACKIPESDVLCRPGPQLPVASLIQQFEGRKPPQIPHLTFQLEQEDQQSDLEKPQTPPKLESPLSALHRWVAMLVISKGKLVHLLMSSTHIPSLHHCTCADGHLKEPLTVFGKCVAWTWMTKVNLSAPALQGVKS